MRSFGRKAEPIRNMAHANIRRERGAGKILRTRLARDPIAADINLVRPDCVASHRRASAGHRVGREKHSAGGLGTDKIFEHRRGQMDPVRNEAGNQFVPGKETLDNVFVAVQLQRTTVTKVRAKACPGANRCVNLRVISLRMAKRNVHTLPSNRRDKLGAAWPLRRERDQAQATIGGGLQALKIS